MVLAKIENETFNSHFDLERRLSSKCSTVISLKLMDKWYVAKKLSKEIVELQKFANLYHKKEQELRNPERIMFQHIHIDILDAWANMPPQMPD